MLSLQILHFVNRRKRPLKAEGPPDAYDSRLFAASPPPAIAQRVDATGSVNPVVLRSSGDVCSSRSETIFFEHMGLTHALAVYTLRICGSVGMR